MSIGSKIKSVFVKAGASFTILRDSGDIAGGYLTEEPNTQITKPFIRAFFREGSLAYDTEVIAGDVVEIDTDERRLLVMTRTPEMFKDEIVQYNAVLYLANVSGELLRPSDSTRDAQYHTELEWTSVKTNCHALLTETLFGHELETDEELGQLVIEKHELYVPHSVGVQIHDRYQPVAEEYYEVETIKTRRYDSIDICGLKEDHR